PRAGTRRGASPGRPMGTGYRKWSRSANAGAEKLLPVEDLRNEKRPAVGAGGVGEGVFAGEGGEDDVVAEDVDLLDGMGHRFDAFGIDFIEDVDVLEQLGELRAVGLQLFGSELEARQFGHFADIVRG